MGDVYEKARAALNAPAAPVDDEDAVAAVPTEPQGTTAQANAAAQAAAEEAMAQAEAAQRRNMARVRAEGDGEVDGFLARAAKQVKRGWAELEEPIF